jgi:SAM-dependent methyltransferase
MGHQVHPPVTLPWATVTFQRHRHISRLLEPFLPQREPAALLEHLDFGGYNGFTAYGLRQTLGLRSTIADLDPTGLRVAAALEMDVIALAESSVPENAYDLVTSIHVVEHIDNPTPSIEAIRRSLRSSGGIFYCEVPNLLGYPMVNSSHLSAFSVEGILRLLEGAGFTILSAGFCSTPDVARDFHYRHASPWEAIYVIATPDGSLATDSQRRSVERFRTTHSINGPNALTSALQRSEARILLHTSKHDLSRGIKSVMRGGFYMVAAVTARFIRSTAVIRIATRFFESFRRTARATGS